MRNVMRWRDHRLPQRWPVQDIIARRRLCDALISNGACAPTGASSSMRQEPDRRRSRLFAAPVTRDVGRYLTGALRRMLNVARDFLRGCALFFERWRSMQLLLAIVEGCLDRVPAPQNWPVSRREYRRSLSRSASRLFTSAATTANPRPGAGPCRLDRGIERQQVGLARNLADQFHHAADFSAALKNPRAVSQLNCPSAAAFLRSAPITSPVGRSR